MAGTAIILLGFYAYSQTRPPIGYGFFSHPPLYGRFEPVLEPLALTVIPTGLLLAGVGWFVTSGRRVPTWAALGAIVVCGVAVAATIALVRGDWHDLVRGVATEHNAPYYTSDLHFVYEYGVRGFVERHPEITDQFHAYNSRTHPAGVFLILYALFEVFGSSHTLRITTTIAFMAMVAAVSAWSMARTLGGERAGRIAAVLFVAAPGPLLLAYTGMDAIYATFLSAAAALFMLAIQRLSVPVAVAAGAVLALGTLLTFATSFIVLAATIAVIVQAGSLRNAAKLLGAAAGGGLAVFVLARLLLGFDIVASYQASPQSGGRSYTYWIFGSPAACLIWAGLPLAALGVAGLVRKVPDAKRPVLPMALVAIMVVWAMLPGEVTKLRPGEVERTWAFLYPVLAATAGLVVDRWTRGKGRWSGAIVSALVIISVGQTVLIQSLWDNLL
jgi:Dolichyl-phosphate-mannose-protein mannosyltransferase